MKKYILYFAGVAALLMASCSVSDDLGGFEPNAPEGKLLLNFSAEGSRAAGPIADTDVESKVTHVDLFLFASDANAVNKNYYERFEISATLAESYELAASKSDFDPDVGYDVYLIANAPQSESELDAITTATDLEAQVITTPMIHMTGIEGSGIPETFFMSGKGTETVINNPATIADDVLLRVNLERAAAKVEVTFHIPDSSTSLIGFGDFAGDLDDAGVAVEANYTHAGGYYLDDMSYSASMYMLSPLHVPARRTTAMVESSPYFTGKYSDVVATVYLYPYTWEEATHNDAPKLVVNLPAVVKDETNYVLREQNYYEIRLRVKDSSHSSTDINSISRNTFYQIHANVSALGANTPVTPVEIENITYAVHDWSEVDVNIGGDGQAQYLTLNTYDFEMHDVAVDNTTLRFTSSSEIEKIEVVGAYYIDKFGQTVTLYPSTAYGAVDGWYDPVDESDGSNLDNEVLNASNIYATAASGIAGQITVNTPVPTNDTPRYLTFRVTNAQGLTRDFTVTQYPVISITNIQAKFSYRTDFGSWYTHEGDRRSSASAQVSGMNVTWNLSNFNSNSFFTSKVATNYYTTGNNAGKSRINYYYWRQRGSYFNPYYELTTQQERDPGNPRIYHVTINSTDAAGEYIVGRPRVDANGYTETGGGNAKLVSPSFMIASQLGTTQSQSNTAVSHDHCSKYVEVYIDENGDEVHLKGWRLPTEAEVKIIMQRQYLPNAAVDEVLRGQNYHSASGPVNNPNGAPNSTGTYTRCVRDHYPAAGTATNN